MSKTDDILDAIIRFAGSPDDVAKAIQDEFYLVPKDSSLPLPAAVHAATMVVINAHQKPEESAL